MMPTGPAVPTFIFRGHNSAIHALHFFHQNHYLASGDADGWIIVWSLATKRPLAVWKSHEGGIMSLKDWGHERLISHGRDHVVRVWQLRTTDFEGMSIRLPVEGADASNCKSPWLLHSMAANALNYCALSCCEETMEANPDDGNVQKFPSLLIAAPNGLDSGGIDIFQLPSQRRVNQLPSDSSIQSGMVMALSMFQSSSTQKLTLVSGYESGHVIVSSRRDTVQEWIWDRLLVALPHSQPVLSIDVDTENSYFMSSGADAMIAKFTVPATFRKDTKPDKVVNTKHAGQQDITIRDDGRICTTAGWDKRVRVYSTKSIKELAVLKWHQEGCYAVAFAKTNLHTEESKIDSVNETSLMKSPLGLLIENREAKAQSVHWLAAGGKDCKISLWDIY